MKSSFLLPRMIFTSLLLFLLTGCRIVLFSTPTPVPPSATPAPTFTSTPTIVPTSTSTPTSTPVPIPPIPTFQVLGDYKHPTVEITDLQGVKKTVQVDFVVSGDLVLDYEFNLVGISPRYLPLKIGEGVYVLIPWHDFRRAYLTEEGFTVTMANGQDLKGQLVFDLVENDTHYPLESISTMVLTGLAKTDLPFINDTGSKENTTTFDLQIPGAKDGAFIVSYPNFIFEFTVTVINQGGGRSSHQEAGFTDIFSLAQEDVLRKISSQDEIRLSADGQLIARIGDIETTGELLPLPRTTTSTVSVHKGKTPSWCLAVRWHQTGLLIVIKDTPWTLTRR